MLVVSSQPPNAHLEKNSYQLRAVAVFLFRWVDVELLHCSGMSMWPERNSRSRGGSGGLGTPSAATDYPADLRAGHSFPLEPQFPCL